MSDRDLYSVQEVAERYNVTPKTIQRWIKEGLFPGATKKNPLGANSPYEIPQSAIDHYEKLRNATSNN